MTRKAARARQLTIRFDRELAERLHRIARRDEVSLNQAAVRLLRQAAGMPSPEVPRDPSWVERHAGTWTEEEARELDRAVAIFEEIEPEMWKGVGRKTPAKKHASRPRRSSR